MSEWISIIDEQPQKEQDVFYFFEMLGVYKGKYKPVNYYEGMEDVDPIYGDCFYSVKGFLTDDVTHWMPAPSDEEWDGNLPDVPDDYVEVTGTHFNGYTHRDNAILVRKDEFEGMNELRIYCRQGHLLGLSCPECKIYHIYWEEDAGGYQCPECERVYDTKEVEDNPTKYRTKNK